jgi:hypothetical protein
MRAGYRPAEPARPAVCLDVAHATAGVSQSSSGEAVAMAKDALAPIALPSRPLYLENPIPQKFQCSVS